MFAPLSVAAFAKKTDKLPKKLSSLRFEELLALNAAEIEEQYRLKSKDAAVITTILHSLLEGDTQAVATNTIDAVASLLPPRPPRVQSSLGINSVEAELKLTAALAKLRTNPMLKSLAHHHIGDYWDSSWARAPFEEALTFEQLSQLRPRALLDKRSFTPQKLTHLLEALDRALKGHSTPSAPTPPQDSTPMQSQATQTISIHRWKSDSTEYSSALLGSLLLYADEGSKIPVQFTELQVILRAIPERLTAREYLAAILQEELDLPTASTLLKIDPNSVRQCTEAAYQKVEALLKELAPVLYQCLIATLSQPATQIATFSQLLRPDAPPSQFITTISLLLARALGATPVTIGGHTQKNFWSRNNAAAERAVRLIVAGLPKSDAELQADATALLGSIPFDTVREWLKPLTYFSERTLIWSKRE